MNRDEMSRRMWAEACDMLDRAERLHRQFFRPGRASGAVASWEPPVDVFETDRAYWILVALPGVDARNLEVAREGDWVTVAGQRRLPRVARDAVIHRLEIPHGRFERRIKLPSGGLKLEVSELTDGCLLLGLTKEI